MHIQSSSTFWAQPLGLRLGFALALAAGAFIAAPALPPLAATTCTAGTLTIPGTAGVDTIVVRDYNAATDGANCGAAAVTTVVVNGAFTVFANKTTVTINAGNGNDTLTISTTVEATNLATLRM